MSKTKKLTAVVCEAGVPNKNRRIYPKHVLEQQIVRMQDSINQRTWMGELGVPKSTIINHSKASHLIIALYMDDDKLIADIETLVTLPGKDLRNLLAAGVDIGFRMSGVGGGKVNDDGNLVIDESYKLIQIFACNDPA